MTAPLSATSSPLTFPCGGCGTAVQAAQAQRARNRRWCADCVHLVGDFYTIERAGRLLAKYGLADAAHVLDEALSEIRDQLRAGTGPAQAERMRAIHAAAMRERARGSRHEYELINELAPLASVDTSELAPYLAYPIIEEDLFGDFAAQRRGKYLDEFAHSTQRDDGATPADLLRAARAYLEVKLVEDDLLIWGSHSEQPTTAIQWPSLDDTVPGAGERRDEGEGR